jgi:hypothetical protein
VREGERGSDKQWSFDRNYRRLTEINRRFFAGSKDMGKLCSFFHLFILCDTLLGISRFCEIVKHSSISASLSVNTSVWDKGIDFQIESKSHLLYFVSLWLKIGNKIIFCWFFIFVFRIWMMIYNHNNKKDRVTFISIHCRSFCRSILTYRFCSVHIIPTL